MGYILFSNSVHTHIHKCSHTHTQHDTWHQYHQEHESLRDLLSIDSRGTGQSELTLEGNRQQEGL